MWPFNWIQVGAGAIIATGLCLLLHNADVARIEAKWLKKLNTQKEMLEQTCRIEKERTRQEGQNYENIIARRDADITELQKRPAKCVALRPASSGDAAGGQVQPDSGNGLPSSVLYRFASFCETDRGKAEILQNYSKEVRK